MKKCFAKVYILVFLFVITIAFVAGCTSDLGNTSPMESFTGDAITAENARQIAWETFRQNYNDPQAVYSPGKALQDSRILKDAAVLVNNHIASGVKESHVLNEIIADPYDGNGTRIMSGNYTLDEEMGDWEAGLTLVYEDFHVEISPYTPSEYSADGTIHATISYKYSTGEMEASLSYAGYHIINGSDEYLYTGSIVQNGVLVEQELVSYEALANMTLNSETESDSGSLVISCITNMEKGDEEGSYTLSVSGNLVYSLYNGISGVAIFESETPLYVSSSGDTENGEIHITDGAGNELDIKITGADQVLATLNDETIFIGSLSDFCPPPVEGQLP